jgi:vacuolar-type H+-ATPase subunit I/STV1
MNVSEQSQTKTRTFSRVIGPFLVIICVTAVARASDIQALFSQFEANSLWTWVIGASALALGLTMVAVHQYWRGAAAVIVSVLGWLVVLRGVLLLAFPSAFISMANSMIGAQGLWVALAVGFALVGLYLTYYGWFQALSQPAPGETSSTKGLPTAP